MSCQETSFVINSCAVLKVTLLIHQIHVLSKKTCGHSFAVLFSFCKDYLFLGFLWLFWLLRCLFAALYSFFSISNLLSHHHIAVDMSLLSVYLAFVEGRAQRPTACSFPLFNDGWRCASEWGRVVWCCICFYNGRLFMCQVRWFVKRNYLSMAASLSVFHISNTWNCKWPSRGYACNFSRKYGLYCAYDIVWNGPHLFSLSKHEHSHFWLGVHRKRYAFIWLEIL